MGVSMDLNFVRLTFTLHLEQDGEDPYALFGIKPFFEETLLQTSCCTYKAGLSLAPCQCPYHQTFSQSLSTDPAALRRYQKPSLPFIFQIPVLPPLPNRGSTVELGLVLTGRAIVLLSEYVNAVTLMFRNPRLCNKVSVFLEKVESSDYSGTRSLLREEAGTWASGNLATLSFAGVRESEVLPTDSVTLSIVTPMRLMVEGRPLRGLSFSPFIRSLMRRVSSMVYYAGGSEPKLDYKWLADRSRMVSCSLDALDWEEWGGKWSGLTGRATFTGDLAEFHPFLLAGEYLNVGKGATFGLGRYILEKTV
jgi:CRISPR/Cas system endoribonuclease Cas6 (RAMP superfamily)